MGDRTVNVNICLFLSITVNREVLAGTEFFFSLIARMLLCFGFVTKTVLVTHQRFSCACATSGVSLFTPVHPFFFCRCSQDSWLRGCSIPSDAMFISKSLRKVGERGWYLWQWHLSSWVTLRHAFWDMAEHHLPGQWEVVNEFKVNEFKFVPCFACACSFCFSYQTVAVSILSPSHRSGKWMGGCVAV